MSYKTLLLEITGGVALITINRPDKLNALNDQVVDELAHAAERIASEDAIQGAVLTGAGTKAFVAGADIADLAKQGPFDGKARALRGQAMLRRLETCGKPVIAAVNGYALGGGCELAMACHLRIAKIGRATSELQSHSDLVCRLLLEKKKKKNKTEHKNQKTTEH